MAEEVCLVRLYQAGERSAGLCVTCRSTVATRMEYRNYCPTGWDVTVPDVLLAVCGRCGGVVGVPHQSTPRINEYRKEKSPEKKGIEARVPRVIEDVLELVAASLGGPSKIIRPAVLRYYLGQVVQSPIVARAVKARSNALPGIGNADRRLAVKLDDPQRSKVLEAAKAVGITSKAQLLRGVAMLVAEDCQIAHIHLPQPENGGTKHNRAARARYRFLKEMARIIG